MSKTILKVDHISKQYRLGTVGTGTLTHDLNRLWHSLRGKEDPYLKIGAVNDRSATATSDYVWALQDINFEVKRGEVLGIIGKNGAGKSTLLKILSRVTAPTTGSIKTRGRIASLLEVGTGMHPELTGRENIFLNGAILGMTKAEIADKIDEIVAFSGCEMYIDTPVKRYSSGMRVRLGFAVAAFLEPDILVVDEVLAVGDAEFQKKAIGKMQDVSSQGGRTVLFVSHNMAAVRSLCTRCVVLKNGTSVFDGDTDDAVDFYLDGNKVSDCGNLLLRTDRKGNGAIRFTNVSLIDKNNKEVTVIDSLSSLKILLAYQRDESIALTALKISVIIYDLNMNIISAFPSDEYYYKHEANSENFITLNIDTLNLRHGSYMLSIYSFDNTLEPVNYVDTIDNVVQFEVLPIKIDDNGRLSRNLPGAFMKAYYS